MMKRMVVGAALLAAAPFAAQAQTPLQPGGFSFCLCQDRLDPALHPRAFGARPMPAAVKIWPPTALHNFFEGPGGYCS